MILQLKYALNKRINIKGFVHGMEKYIETTVSTTLYLNTYNNL